MKINPFLQKPVPITDRPNPFLPKPSEPPAILLTIDEQACSNFRHDKPFVVQAWCSLINNWLDTIHGGSTLTRAVHAAHLLWQDDTRWVHGNRTKLRIVPRLKINQ